ncbi:YbaB/EbfC family nucleoid-associated protein [Streptomyces sp. NPDC002144]
MSESINDRVAEAMAHLTATQEAVAKATSELNAASMTAHSAGRAVRVTVGGKGELTSLEFLDGKYRAMDAPQVPADLPELRGLVG